MVDQVPAFLGQGVRYFEAMDPAIALEGPVEAVEGDRVLHLHYAIKR